VEAHIQSLLQVMTEEKEIYQALLEASQQKKDILIKNDLPSLSSVIQKESNLLKKAKTVEAHRLSIVDQMALERGMDADNFPLQTLIGMSEGPLKQALSELRTQFGQVVEDLKESNEVNRRLIQTHLEYTSFCIRLMTQTTEQGQMYDNKGNTNEETAKSRVFDKKV